MIMEKVLILSAKKYSFTDKQTSELREGVIAYYVPALESCISDDGLTKGHVPIKAGFNIAQFSNFNAVPGYYDIDYDLVADSQGKLNAHYNSVKSAKS